MINIKSEYERMINNLEGVVTSDIYRLSILSSTKPIILAGIDALDKSRQLYIEIGKEAWEEEQVNSLPKWRGLSIKQDYFEKLGPIMDRYFLILKQETEESAEIFESVLQNIIHHLSIKDNKSLFNVIYPVLDKWRNFFLKGGYKTLTEKQQRGLFGELYYLEKWIEHHPSKLPLIIENWEGPTSGRIDFINSKTGVEIKTCVDKLRNEITISNENQLRLTEALENLYLYVCYLEPNKVKGQSLQEIIDNIRNHLNDKGYHHLLLKFNELLLELRFRENEYTDTLYFVFKEEVFIVTPDFPKITKDILPLGVSNVSYNIDLSHCEEFKCQVDKVFIS